MVWSEQIGNALIVPGDKEPGDGRDWISLGEDVPDELKQYLSAGIFFRNGTYIEDSPEPFMQVKYFGMGAKLTRFFQFVYIENDFNVPGAHKLVNLTSFDFDDEFMLRSNFGPYVDDSDYPRSTNTISGGHLRRYDSFFTEQFPSLLAGFTQYSGGVAESGLTWRLTPDGMVHINGLFRNSIALVSGGHYGVIAIPPLLRKPKNSYHIGMVVTSTGGTPIRVDARGSDDTGPGLANKVCIITAPALAIGNNMYMDLSYSLI